MFKEMGTLCPFSSTVSTQHGHRSAAQLRVRRQEGQQVGPEPEQFITRDRRYDGKRRRVYILTRNV